MIGKSIKWNMNLLHNTEHFLYHVYLVMSMYLKNNGFSSHKILFLINLTWLESNLIVSS